MREIKFRGQSRDNYEWLIGSLIDNVHYKDEDDVRQCWIVSETFNLSKDFINDYEVFPETVGQLTGLLDKNGKEIYEGDICKSVRVIGRIEYESQAAAYWLKWEDGGKNYFKELQATFSDGETFHCDWIEVIGNIHENPELLK